ncbi:MAG: hypothetical protein U1E51_21810 [Candidatus Binatia bacterium]|nr:hypothetical protein [Candidatus Binatia bacterium]
MTIQPLTPASAQQKSDAERKRIPMSVPVQRLEAPDIPGYHLHWFIGTAERLQRALDGGYEYVDERELKLNNAGLGGESTKSGNTDMGSRVSVVSGQEVGKDGQPTRLILMKIKQEWFEEDQKLVENRNEKVAASLRGGTIGAEQDKPGESKFRYVDKSRTKIPDLFTPKRPKTAA